MYRKKIRALKICSLVLFLFFCLFVTRSVKAERVVIGDYVDRIYIKKMKGGSGQYLRSQWVYKESDNKFVYCLEPWIIIDDSQEYNQLWSWNASSNITYSTWNKVKLIAYYGYGYDGHNDAYWYTLTQMLIWKEIDPAADFYFTDTLNGNRVNIYEEQMNEIMNLVNKHYVLPSFVPRLYTASINKDFELVDTNNVLELFDIKNDNNNVVKSKSGDKLTVYSSAEKRASVDLVKKSNKYTSIPFIYISDNSQNVMSVGRYDDLNTNVNFQFVSGSIELHKLDKDTRTTKSPKGLTLENAEYQVLDEHGKIVDILKTDNNGEAKISNLTLGKYFIKEIKESYGYKIDDKIYEINLTTVDYNKVVNVYEELDKKELIISKQYLDLDNNTTLPEKDITFEIYEHDTQSLVDIITTDNKGVGSIKLTYGIYTVKQINAKDDYQKVRDFNIIIDKDTKDIIIKELVNYPFPKEEVYIYPINKSYINIVENKSFVDMVDNKRFVNVIEIPNTSLNKNNYKVFLIVFLYLLNANKCWKKYENN